MTLKQDLSLANSFLRLYISKHNLSRTDAMDLRDIVHFIITFFYPSWYRARGRNATLVNAPTYLLEQLRSIRDHVPDDLTEEVKSVRSLLPSFSFASSRRPKSLRYYSLTVDRFWSRRRIWRTRKSSSSICWPAMRKQNASLPSIRFSDSATAPNLVRRPIDLFPRRI